MTRDLVILMKLVKAHQKKAEEVALINARWRSKLAALEGEILAVAEGEIDKATAPDFKDLLS